MSNYKYGQFAEEHLENIKIGLEYFDKEKYWECHEILEDHWLEAKGDNARFVYWSVIQAAVSLYHARERNLPGARGMLDKAKDKISKCEELKVETDLLNKIKWTQFKTLVKKIPDTPTLEDFENLFKFKFKVKD